MGFKKLSNNKYKISVELGYDILGNRKRKTEIFCGSFKEVNNPKEAIHPVLVTTYGLRSNEYSNIFQRIITLKDLFQQR